MVEKSSLRRELLQFRMALPTDLYQDYSDRICRHLQKFLVQQISPGQTVLVYQPHRQEPDLQTMWDHSSYTWGLPRCLPQQQLDWHYWQPVDRLKINTYGLAEPLAESPLVLLESVAALLIPVVGFNTQGFRLGYGGGYFDRLLANPSWQKVLTVGVAFDQSLVTDLPIDPWDIPLHRICTESGIVVDLV